MMQFSHSKRTVIMKRLLLPILAALLLLPPAPAPAAEGAAPRHVAYDQGAGRTSALPVVKTGSYVYLPTGTYTFDATDLEVAGRGVPLALERTYRSNLVPRGPDDQYDFKEPADGPFGFGWHSPWFVRLWQGNVKNSNGSEAFFYYFLDGDGRIYDFSIGADGSIAPNTAAGLTLTRLPFGFELSRHRGESYSFDDDGRLTRVRDPQGRETALQLRRPEAPGQYRRPRRPHRLQLRLQRRREPYRRRHRPRRASHRLQLRRLRQPGAGQAGGAGPGQLPLQQLPRHRQQDQRRRRDLPHRVPVPRGRHRRARHRPGRHRRHRRGPVRHRAQPQLPLRLRQFDGLLDRQPRRDQPLRPQPRRQDHRDRHRRGGAGDGQGKGRLPRRRHRAQDRRRRGDQRDRAQRRRRHRKAGRRRRERHPHHLQRQGEPPHRHRPPGGDDRLFLRCHRGAPDQDRARPGAHFRKR